MGSPLPSSPARRSERSGRVALFGGVLIVGALVALDIVWGSTRVISGTVVIGPFFAALRASPRQTAWVSALAVLAAVASGVWNDNFGEAAYLLRCAVVVIGSGFAVYGARSRVRDVAGRARLALLAAVAEVADGSRSLEDTVEALNALIVPVFADVGIFDVMRHGDLRRSSVRASGPDAADLQAVLLAQAPQPAETLESRLIAADKDVGLPWRLIVPLRSRGRVLGVMTLGVARGSRRRYGVRDLQFAEVLAGRAALALDNAGMFAELQTMEAQLTAALGSLADAVTVQTPEGRLIYANEAAAEQFGFASAADLISTPPQEIADRYESYEQDGSPVRLDRLPGRRVLRGEDPSPLLVRVIHKRTREERWRLIKATAVRGDDGRPRLAVNVIEDVTEIKRVEFAQRLLAEAGDVLASSLEYELTLQRVARLAVPELADWCAVTLPDERGSLRQVAVAHVDENQAELARELARRYPAHVDDVGGVAEVVRSGSTQVVNDVTDDMLRASAQDAEHFQLLKRLGIRAALVVPLMVGGRAIGALSLAISDSSARAFSDDDRQLAEELARRAGVAVENARLYTERSSIAATLQASLLPQDLPSMAGFATATLYRAAGSENLVGGDFYDVFPITGGWVLVVGDVAGRGAPAAALTALARHTLRAVTQTVDDPLAAIRRLNDELYARTDTALCTLACAVVRERDDEAVVRLACAGHPPPFLIAGGIPTQLGRLSPMVGAFADSQWDSIDFVMRPSDVLVLYTDGVLDLVGVDERFGEARLAAAVTGSTSARDAVDRLAAALEHFGVHAAADDIAVVALERLSVSAPTAPALTTARGGRA